MILIEVRPNFLSYYLDTFFTTHNIGRYKAPCVRLGMLCCYQYVMAHACVFTAKIYPHMLGTKKMGKTWSSVEYEPTLHLRVYFAEISFGKIQNKEIVIFFLRIMTFLVGKLKWFKALHKKDDINFISDSSCSKFTTLESAKTQTQL